jgi:hypothetical protein
MCEREGSRERERRGWDWERELYLVPCKSRMETDGSSPRPCAWRPAMARRGHACGFWRRPASEVVPVGLAVPYPGGRAHGGGLEAPTGSAPPRRPRHGGQRCSAPQAMLGGPVGPCVRNKGNGRGMGGRAGGDRRRGGVVVKKKLTSGPHV